MRHFEKQKERHTKRWRSELLLHWDPNDVCIYTYMNGLMVRAAGHMTGMHAHTRTERVNIKTPLIAAELANHWSGER